MNIFFINKCVNYFVVIVDLQEMNLAYFVKLLIIITIISYDVLITKSCDSRNSIIKFIVIFLKGFFNIGSD